MVIMEGNCNTGPGRSLLKLLHTSQRLNLRSFFVRVNSFVLTKKLFSQAGRSDLVTKAGEEEWERLVIYIFLILELNGV